MHVELVFLIAVATFQVGYLVGLNAGRNAATIEAKTKALTAEIARIGTQKGLR